MICLVIGGAKSGKSMYAQNLSKELENKDSNLYYVATMSPYDEDDLKRIENHLKEREGYGFQTIEVQRNIDNIINKIEKNDTLLIDSLTSLVTNEMFVLNEFNENIQNNIIMSLKNISKNGNIWRILNQQFKGFCRNNSNVCNIFHTGHFDHTRVSKEECPI